MNEEATPESIAKEAAAFLECVADEIIRRKIPPQAAISLFGVMARQIVDGLIECGKSKEDAISEVAGRFMDGLGVQTIFKRVTLDDGKPLH
jgi:hypothetical protein